MRALLHHDTIVACLQTSRNSSHTARYRCKQDLEVNRFGYKFDSDPGPGDFIKNMPAAASHGEDDPRVRFDRRYVVEYQDPVIFGEITAGDDDVRKMSAEIVKTCVLIPGAVDHCQRESG